MAGNHKRNNAGKCPQTEGPGPSDSQDPTEGLGQNSHCEMGHVRRSTGSMHSHSQQQHGKLEELVQCRDARA